MDPEVVIPEVVAIGLGYVLLPAMAVHALGARRPHPVTCPENGAEAIVRLDPKRAVRALFSGAPQRVVACSRWPERSGCDRACEAAVSA